MFWNKNKSASPKEPDMVITTIPEEFYNGADPEIHFKKVIRNVNVPTAPSSAPTNSERKLLNQTTVAGGQIKWHPANLFSSPKKMLLFALGLFAVFILVSAAWYFFKIRSQNNTVTPNPPAVSSATPNSVPAVATPPSDIGNTDTAPTPEPVVPAPVAYLSELPPFQVLGDSVDLDNDGLTDADEEVMTTDPGIVDTDNDSYPDGLEVYHLYNPAGIAPQKLIDADLVVNYTNPVSGYQVYYPRNWAVGDVDQTGQQLLFNTITGENIEARTWDLMAGESLSDWLKRVYLTEPNDHYRPFSGVFNTSGLERSDNLVYFFVDSAKVYGIIYHTTDSTVVNHRALIKMMARSFRLPGNALAMPEQVNEEASSTPVI
jgi:hypothetical protein